MIAVARTLLNIAASLAALAVLGLLLVVSTSLDDRQHRQFDQAVAAVSITSDAQVRYTEAANRRGVDVAEALAQARADLARHSQLLTRQVAATWPDTALRRSQNLAINAFNALQPGSGALHSASTMQRLGSGVTQAAEQLQQASADFAEQHSNYLASAAALDQAASQRIQALREQGQDRLADQVYGALRQSLDHEQLRSRQAIERARSSIARLSGTANAALATTANTVLDDRAAAMAAASAVQTANPAPALAALADASTRDFLYRLTSVNDAQVVLNIYTGLLLVVLVWFGLRLRRSYAELASINESLEDRVAKRTNELASAYDSLKNSQVQLVQAEKMSSLGQLVAGVAHEVNTPLLYVLNNTNMIVDNVADMAQAAGHASAIARQMQAEGSARVTVENIDLAGLDTEMLDETREETVTLAADCVEGLEQISELVQGLKDFSRLDRAEDDLFDVRQGVEKTLVIAQNMLKYGITVEKDLQEVPLVPCSPSRINQIFLNLVTNAVQAMDSDGTLRLHTSATASHVLVSVEDTGCGISKENLARITDPFFTTKPVGEGTGLGLSIVRQIIDSHQGELDIQSEEGVGTCITVRLPLQRSAADSANDTPATKVA